MYIHLYASTSGLVEENVVTSSSKVAGEVLLQCREFGY
jgi:hypothetical protein